MVGGIILLLFNLGWLDAYAPWPQFLLAGGAARPQSYSLLVLPATIRSGGGCCCVDIGRVGDDGIDQYACGH